MKTYFASDFHLGAPDKTISLERERRVIRWLDHIKKDAESLYFLGDIFDFWYEWNNVIPKGFYRFLTKLAEIAEAGVKIYYFTGNHDVWQYHYLHDEFGVQVFTEPQLIEINGRRIYMGHGDGLGSGSWGFSIIKWIFTNKVTQFLYTNFFHPNLAMWIGFKWSESRHQYTRKTFPFQKEGEHIIRYIRSVDPKENADVYIFGHRHIEVEYDLGDGKKYINTGAWYHKSPYAVMDENGEVKLMAFE